MRVIPDQCTKNEISVMLTADDLERITFAFAHVEHYESKPDEGMERLHALLRAAMVFNDLVADPDRRIADVLAEDFVQSVSRS